MSLIPDPASILPAPDSTENEGARVPLEINGDRTVVVRITAPRAGTARSRIAANVRRVSGRKAEIPSNGATRTATYKPVAIGWVAGCRSTRHGAVARITKINVPGPYAGQITGDSSCDLIQVGANQDTTSCR